MEGPYSEKLWLKSLKWKGSIFKSESQFFTIRKDPKPANKLFTFPSFSQIVSIFLNISTNSTYVSLWPWENPYRATNQPDCMIGTVPSWKKKRKFWYHFLLLNQLPLQSLRSDFHPIAIVSLNHRSNWHWRVSRSKIVFHHSLDYLFIPFRCLLLKLGFSAHLKKRRTDAIAFKSSDKFNKCN